MGFAKICPNVGKGFRETLIPQLLRTLLIAPRKDSDRVVLSADKGNCVVVMDKHQYREKVLSMLNDKQTYTALKSDPTGRIERDLNQRLLLLKKSNKVSEKTYKLLRSSDGLAPRL